MTTAKQATFIEFRSHDGLRITADQWGPAGGPPVLLLHGGGQSRHAWKNTGANLARHGFQVIAPDARGHGDSEWSPTGQYDMHDFGRDVEKLLEQFDVLPAVVGASMGGMSALLAQQQSLQQLFSAVVLVDVTPRMELGGVARIMEFMTANPNGFASLEEASDVIASYNPARKRSPNTSGLERILRRTDDGRWSWRWDPAFVTWRTTHDAPSPEAFEEHMDVMSEELYTGAEAITCPMLLVRGQQSELVTDDVADEFRSRLPEAAHVDIRGAGHMVAGDDNDAFSEAVSDFLTASISVENR